MEPLPSSGITDGFQASGSVLHTQTQNNKLYVCRNIDNFDCIFCLVTYVELVTTYHSKSSNYHNHHTVLSHYFSTQVGESKMLTPNSINIRNDLSKYYNVLETNIYHLLVILTKTFLLL
jgi:hypothetical protein